MENEIRENINKIKSWTKSLNENRSGFIIGSEPLETSMKLKVKLQKILNLLEGYENIVINEFHSESEDYSEDVLNIVQKISSLSNDIKIEDLEISLGDFNHKNVK